MSGALVRDAHARQTAETGVEPVHGLPALQRRVDNRARTDHRLARDRREREANRSRNRCARDPRDIANRERRAVEDDHVGGGRLASGGSGWQRHEEAV